MTRDEARTRLAEIVSATSTPVLSATDLDAALDAARVRDDSDLGPADQGYVETFDLDYAAAEAFETKAVRQAGQPMVEEFSAEGARFKRKAPDFWALANTYRSRSTAGRSGIGVIELDPQGGFTPRSSYPC